MFARFFACLTAGMIVTSATAVGGDWPFLRHKAAPEQPNSMVQIAKSIDSIEEKIRDDGFVVIKQPDVWGQARMTKYRVDFEKSIMDNLKFEETLSAVISRADRAALESQTAIGGSLIPMAKGAGGGVQVTNSSSDDSGKGQAALVTAAQDMIKNAKDKDNLNEFEKTETFKLLKDASTVFKAKDAPVVGLEPTVLLEEKKTFYDRLNQYRRQNFGDDSGDSAGYNLYQFSLPVSIQPGQKTHRDHGAQVTATVQHEFGPDFLASTFRNFVINDLVDIFTPIVYETIKTKDYEDYWEKIENPKNISKSFKEIVNEFEIFKHEKGFDSSSLSLILYKNIAPGFSSSNIYDEDYPIAPSDLVRTFGESNLDLVCGFAYQSRQTKRPRATDIRSFLQRELSSAYDLMAGNCRDGDPLLADTEFLSNLAHHIQSREFDRLYQMIKEYLMPLFPDFESNKNMWHAQYKEFRSLVDKKKKEENNTLTVKEETLLKELWPRTQDEPEYKRPIIALCWAIAVDAALLNCRFRQELREYDGINGFHLTCDPESFFFHLPMPKEPGGDPIYEVSQSIFEEYVKARWPIVCFSLDPINDQQNIADAFSRTRDLQVALAMAFSSGQLGFNQLLKYRRQLDYEASTIALNRTISAFILGNETFGWRFAPRFQTPPQEKSNLHVIANQVIRGGPGRDYQIKNSKLEAGQRELSAVIIMPSILQRVRMDVTGNWYRLSDPDETTLHTAHMLEQGRKVMELRKALSTACDSGCYRPDDLSRMMVKVNQIEAMLPMQTKTISVPYGNTLGGFNIFKKGSSGLAPFLFGYQGVDTLSSESCRNAFLIFGKNISIQETKVVAGGQRVDDDDIEILSREVIRVRLPKNLEKTVTQDGQKYVELHLGTPNGISNRLLLPFDDALVTTTGVTEIIKEETDSTGKRTSWKRSVETKNVTGPRPKCDLDKPETKAADDKKTATHEHQADGGCCIIIQTKPATGGETTQADHDKKQPTKSEQTPKAKDATPEAPAMDKSKGQADATTKPAVNQTTVVTQPNPGGAKQKDGHINRTGLRQKRQSLMNRLMHRNEE